MANFSTGFYPSVFSVLNFLVTQQNLGLKYMASAHLKLGPLTSLGIILLVFAKQIP